MGCCSTRHTSATWPCPPAVIRRMSATYRKCGTMDCCWVNGFWCPSLLHLGGGEAGDDDKG